MWESSFAQLQDQAQPQLWSSTREMGFAPHFSSDFMGCHIPPAEPPTCMLGCRDPIHDLPKAWMSPEAPPDYAG